MPDASTAPMILIVLCYLAALAYAAYSDLRHLEIANAVPIAIAVLFLPAAWLAPLSISEIALHAGTGAGMLVIGFIFFIRGIAGGADAKLMAAVAVWTGIEGLPTFLFVMALAGLLLALAVLLLKKTGGDARLAGLLPWIAEGTGTKAPIPYGVAISTGALFALWQSPFTTALAQQG